MGSTYQLAVSVLDGNRRIALLEGDKLLEYYQEEAEDTGIVGSLYLGRVERVLPDIKAAFVKIGLKQNGFLPIKESESFHRDNPGSALMSGHDIIVQVKKAPKGNKGAFLTRDIALPGQYVLLMPCNRFVGLSKRIEDEHDRIRGKKLGEKVAQGRFGVIVRHAALYVSEADVVNEAEVLWQRWIEIEQKASFRKAPAVLYSEAGMTEVLQRDYSARHNIEFIDNNERWPSHFIDNQLEEALGRRVALPGGGTLVIDEREALQTIDVNTGCTVTAEYGLSLALEENLRAVPEIARQIRLRNLSGIIMIDFIDMDTEEERNLVLRSFEEAIAEDRVKNVIHGFTRLGLLEMTRKRTRESLRDLLTVPCAHCSESGRVVRD